MARDKVKTIDSFDPRVPTRFAVKWHDNKRTSWDIAKLDAETIAHLAWHGLNQKTMDAHAGIFKRTGSIAQCRAASTQVWEMLLTGTWEAERGQPGWLATCLSELRKIPVEKAREMLAGMTKEARKAVENHPDVKKWDAQRRLALAEKAEDAGDLADLLK